MLATRHLNLGFLISATSIFTVLVLTYFITNEKPRVFPSRIKPGQQNDYIGRKYREGNDGAQSRVKGHEVNIHREVVTPVANSDGNYIITQTFGGQMTRAIRNMMLQQCWGADLGYNSHIVEPFSAHSNLYHSVSFWADVEKGKLLDAARFSEFYDLKHYNFKSQKDKSIGLVTWEKFKKNAPRHSVVLVVPQQSCNLGRKNAASLKLSSNCSFTKVFQDFVTGLEKYNFYVVKVVCVDCNGLQSPLTMKELHNELYTGHNFSKITVLIDTWRNLAFTSSWLQVPKFCKLSEDPSTSTRLRPSLMITNHTQYYVKNILRSHGVVAVMFRIERFLTQQVSGRTQNDLTTCMNTTLEIHDKIKKETKFTGTFLTLDVSQYGSHVMQNSDAVSKLVAHGDDSMESITSLAENTIKYIYNGKFTLKTWEDTFIEASGGITEMGYIAMLQRNIATVADCLILMGGGSFQQVAAYQYIHNHPNPSNRCLHTICATPSFDKSFRDYYSV